MNIYKLYGHIGPWATPAPAALALAGRLYGEWAATDKVTGWAVAIFSLAALEVAGGLCSYQMIQASLARRWGWFWACLFGVVAYLALGIYALWGVTAWIYVVLAVFVHISVAAELVTGQARSEVMEDRTYALQEREAKLKEREAELKAAKEITAQVRAEARRAKANLHGPSTEVRGPPRTSVEAAFSCPCGATFDTANLKASHARRCEVWRSGPRRPKAAKGPKTA